MAVKIRLQRQGRKGKPYYHIIIADSRSKRDGKYIEKIGSYNPVTNPATITIDTNKAIEWLSKGAQPTNTVRNILSYKGVLLKKHLMGGVEKGAFDEAEMEKRYNTWLEEKENQVNAKKDGLAKAKEEAKVAKLEAEKKVAEARKPVVEEVAEKVEEAVDVATEDVAEAKDSVEAASESTPEENKK